jgi:hypothetical protein
MIAKLGRGLGRTIRRSGGAVRDLHRDLVQAAECWSMSGRAAVSRTGPMAWTRSIDGYRLTGSYLPEPEPPVR